MDIYWLNNPGMLPEIKEPSPSPAPVPQSNEVSMDPAGGADGNSNHLLQGKLLIH